MRIMMEDVYKNGRGGLDFTDFWRKIVPKEKMLMMLLCETYLKSKDIDDKPRKLKKQKLFEDSGPKCDCTTCPCKSMCDVQPVVPNWPSTLAMLPTLDDKLSKRVHQIAGILRNISFEADNAAVMAKSLALLR